MAPEQGQIWFCFVRLRLLAQAWKAYYWVILAILRLCQKFDNAWSALEDTTLGYSLDGFFRSIEMCAKSWRKLELSFT